MQIIGHRGAMTYKPENTLSSFDEALRLEVDGIELDVWICKSGEVVVFHDETLDKLTDGSGTITEKTLTYLKELEVKHPQPDKQEQLPHNRITIPTLEEVLDLVSTFHIDGKGPWVNIELKGHKTESPVYQIVERYISDKGWYSDKFLISSFDHHQLRAFKDINPEARLRVGALYSGIPVGYNTFIQPLRPYSAHPDVDCIDKNLVDDAHVRGMKVFVWTVNDIKVFKRMLDLGIDGVFTNYPAEMRRYRDVLKTPR